MRCNLTDTVWQIIDKKILNMRSGIILILFYFLIRVFKTKKLYVNYSSYGDKTKDLENLEQGDFVKIFGQVKTSIDNSGKEHKNVRILYSKLLKAKEQVKSQDKDKKSILGKIKALRKMTKLSRIRKNIAKEQRDKYRQSSDCLYFFTHFFKSNL